MGETFTTNFSFGEVVFVVFEAKEKGRLVSGSVESILVVKEHGGTPDIYYRVIAYNTIAPPNNLYRESELANEDDAKALAKTYHELKASTHTLRANSLA